MASERSQIIDFAIIGLLVLNLGVTTYSVLKPEASVEKSVDPEAKLKISDTQAADFASAVIKFYNAHDSAALYQEFDSLAKAQLTEEQLVGQLNQLYPVLGTIEHAAFSNAVLAGTDGGRNYYHLNYKVRLAGGPFSIGDMRLTVTPRGTGLGLMGFYINGTSQASRP